jgi:hypothetical protein
VEAIVALSVDAHGESEEWGVRALLESPSPGLGPGGWTVADEGGEVVSTLCLIPHTWRYAGVDIGAGQVEYVATKPGHRTRGLIRGQMAEVHEWSRARGDLVTWITGIPYFYRLFGYENAIGEGARRRVTTRVEMPNGYTVTPAEPADLDAMRRLHAAAQRAADLAQVRSDEEWQWLFTYSRRWHEDPVVARRGGDVVAFGRVAHGSPTLPVMLRDVSAVDVDGARALAAHAQSVADERGLGLLMRDRPSTAVSALLDALDAPVHSIPWLYARVPDPVALLDRLRPALSARLASSPLAAESGELVISLYRTAIALTYEAGAVVGVEAAAAVQDPEDERGVGVPPDRFATLVLGRYGAVGLETRDDDVTLGTARPLMAALFPPMVNDLVIVL